MLGDTVAHQVTQRIGIPPVTAQKRLLPPRPRIVRCLRGAHPSGLATLVAKQPVHKQPAFNAARSCANSGRIRRFTSRSDDAHNSSVASIEAPVIHDLQIMVIHGFRHQTNAPVKNRN